MDLAYYIIPFNDDGSAWIESRHFSNLFKEKWREKSV